MRCLAWRRKTTCLRIPVAGASWERFAMAQVMAQQGLSERQCLFWATHSGAELDLFVQAGRQRLGYEFKLSKHCAQDDQVDAQRH